MALLNERNTVLLKPMEALQNYEEGRVATGATIYPGMLIELVTAGTYQPHATAGGAGEWNIAIEDGLIGEGVDDSRTAAELIRFLKVQPGWDLYVRIPPSAAAIVKGDDIVSNGDGKFKKTAGATNTVFGTAQEAYDNSANAASDAWVRIRSQSN